MISKAGETFQRVLSCVSLNVLSVRSRVNVFLVFVESHDSVAFNNNVYYFKIGNYEVY